MASLGGMSEKWFFSRGDGDVVELRARFEDDDGTVGDAFNQIRPGQKALNVTYEELLAAGAGVLLIEGERVRIETP